MGFKLDLFLGLVAAVHLGAAPFTKVEESFNVQATHDMVYFGTQFDKYDHLEFAGVVPRTFLGPIVLTAVTAPVHMLLSLAKAPKLASLLVVRAALAALVVLSLRYFRASLAAFTRMPGVKLAHVLICASQFHLMFYSSRPLANVFALGLVNVGAGALLQGKGVVGVWALACSAAVFRCDMVLLAGPLLLSSVFGQRCGLRELIVHGAIASVCLVAVSTAVDSVLWRRLLWPELEVLLFNTWENKSSDWGTSPWHWYFSSVLPRCMMGAVALLPFGLMLNPPTTFKALWSGGGVRELFRTSSVTWALFVPCIVFISLYSLLPHKELRFVLPAVPLLNGVAAVGLVKLWRGSRKGGVLGLLLMAGGVCALLVTLPATGLFLRASSFNYPGGWALQKLHDHIPQAAAADDAAAAPLSVHIGNLAATTGASRYGEDSTGECCTYSKEEGLEKGDLIKFDWIVTEHASVPGFELIASEQGFKRVAFSLSRLPVVEVEPAVYIYKKTQLEP